VRSVIAEDLVLLREGIARLLADAGHTVVAQAGDAHGLIDAVVEHRPDLLIADVRMPPSHTDEGARAALMLRERYPSLPVIILSHVVDPAVAVMMTRRNPAAFGYLLKDRILHTEEFLATVQHVADGGTAIDLQAINAFLQSNEHRLTALTPRELEVLRHLAAGRSNAGIAQVLVTSRRTVEAHLRSVFVKLGLEEAPEDNLRVQAALAWLREGAVAG
jgi:DNA-binding NarL/FixJ family response regulator